MNSMMKEYDLLAKYLEEMIKDGCQLVHGGNLMDWSDTVIPKILGKINKSKKNIQNLHNLELGDQLKHKISGQSMTVVRIDEETIYLNPNETPIKYPLNHISEEFEMLCKN